VYVLTLGGHRARTRKRGWRYMRSRDSTAVPWDLGDPLSRTTREELNRVTDLTNLRLEDVDIGVERVKRHYEVTAKHRPTGAAVTRSGIALNVTRSDALESLEKHLAELEGGDGDEDDENKSD